MHADLRVPGEVETTTDESSEVMQPISTIRKPACSNRMHKPGHQSHWSLPCCVPAGCWSWCPPASQGRHNGTSATRGMQGSAAWCEQCSRRWHLTQGQLSHQCRQASRRRPCSGSVSERVTCISPDREAAGCVDTCIYSQFVRHSVSWCGYVELTFHLRISAFICAHILGRCELGGSPYSLSKMFVPMHALVMQTCLP